jgi:anaerobic selenocysteine-containing dehydrogenase
VSGTNPLRSYADTSAYERAFKALDLLVVLDVAMSETAAAADYILAGRTAYESYDTTFWSFNYPDIFFHLRRPLVKPAAETRENSWIMASLAEEMDLLPAIPDSLYQAAKEDRGLFRQELGRYVEHTPEAMLKDLFLGHWKALDGNVCGTIYVHKCMIYTFPVGRSFSGLLDLEHQIRKVRPDKGSVQRR